MPVLSIKAGEIGLATIKGITIQIGADTTGLDAALKDVNKTSREISKELREVERLLKFNPHDTELLAQKQKLLADQVAATSEKLNGLKNAQSQVNEQYRKGEIPEEKLRAFNRELVKTESQLKHYEKQLKAATLAADPFNAKMQELGDKLKGVGDKATKLGTSLSKTLSVPLAGIGAIATKIGMDFEVSMSKVQAASGATTAEMDALEKAARGAGASTSKSASEAADALGYMALAGWDTKTSVEGLMPVLRLSEAGQIDLARASSLVTDSMAAMGLQVQDLGGYLDTVAQAARNSNTNVDQLAEAYIRVGGTLRGLRVPLDESATALGVLANAGIKGSEAGTSLNAVLLNLTAPAGRAKQALEDLGYSAFDSEGNFKGLEQVLFDLKAMTANMDEEQRNLTLSMIGGKEHVRSLNALLNGLGGGYQDLKVAVLDAEGALDDMATTMMDNTKGSFVELQSALEEFALKIWDVIQPTIRAIIDTIKGLVDRMNEVNPAVLRVVVIIGALVAAFGPALIIIGQMATGAAALVSTFGTLSAFIQTTLIPAIMGINWPVVAVVGAIAALAAVAYEVYRAWDEVKAALSATWEYLKASAERLALNMSLSFEQMKHAVINAVGEILERLSVLENLPFGIGDKFAGLKDKIGEGVDGSKQKIAELEAALETNATRMAEAVDGMKVSWGDVGAKVAEDIQLVINKITGQTEVMAAELDEQTEIVETGWTAQTDFILQELDTQLQAITDIEQEKTEVITDEANKQAEARAKFEADWNRKLFQLTADRLAQLEAEEAEALARAEALEADKTAILEYYSIKRQEISDEEAKQQEAAEQRRLDALAKFEERWSRRLFELQADELERLEREKEEAVRQAEDVGADTTAILEYYAEKELEIRKRRAEEAQKIAEAEADAERRRIEELERARLEFEQQWEGRLFDLTATQEDRLAREREQALARAAELGADVNAILEYYARRQIELAEEIAEEQHSLWEKAFDAVKSPLERFVEAVSNAAEGFAGVVKAIKAGNWQEAFLSVVMETESFAKAMELIGAVLGPVVTLFDAILRPVIEFLIGLWNGIIDALASIKIFGWRPFKGLKKHRIETPDAPEDGSGQASDSSSGGRQISEISGPSRDLLVDLLTPLSNLNSIVAPIQDIRNILYERLPNFNNLELAGVGAGGGGTVVFEPGSIVINSTSSSGIELGDEMMDAIERRLAGRVLFNQRGRGGGW